jgi:GAF domain-containing protein
MSRQAEIDVLRFELAEARAELTAARREQEASAAVLKVIRGSAHNLDAVFQTLVATAVDLCKASSGTLCVRDGDVFRYRGMAGPEATLELQLYLEGHPLVAPTRNTVAGRAILSRKAEQIPDVLREEGYSVPFAAHGSPARSLLAVPLLGKSHVQGAIVVTRSKPGLFPPRHVEILRIFADQAVIALENARLLEEVQARTRDLEESLAQQTATSDVLKAISRSAFDLDTVLETLISTALRLCDAPTGQIFRRHGDVYRYAASRMNVAPAYRLHEQTTEISPSRGTLIGRVALEARAVEIDDAWSDPEYAEKEEARLGNVRAMLGVPLMRNGEPIGAFALARAEPVPFTSRQIELVATFADQAVIAMENVRLFEEVQARTRDLEESLAQQTATADVLKVISRSAFDLKSVSDTLVVSATQLCAADEGIIFLREGDLFRAHATCPFDTEHFAFLREHPRHVDDRSMCPRVARSGRVEHIEDVLLDAEFSFPGLEAKPDRSRTLLGVPLTLRERVEGVFVLGRREPKPFTKRQMDIAQTFADQALIAIENSRLFNQVQARTEELAASLENLRKTQDRLVQSEKLASLGQLTAGIAHEIKNPLNFVNNFASLSRDLIAELKETLDGAPLDDSARADVEELTGFLDSNLEKVAHHGKRADSIVKNMLLHSREGSGERARVNVNVMVEEALNLGYHGARAEKPGFNVTIEKAFDPETGEADLYLQEITRVLLNLVSNGFHATARRQQTEGPSYQPTLTASTRPFGKDVEIRIRDNGTGIPHELREKIFNPFFTTKPAGEGTGLGLSISHDIIVKQHGGSIEVETAPGAFTEFVIILPREGDKA